MSSTQNNNIIVIDSSLIDNKEAEIEDSNKSQTSQNRYKQQMQEGLHKAHQLQQQNKMSIDYKKLYEIYDQQDNQLGINHEQSNEQKQSFKMINKRHHKVYSSLDGRRARPEQGAGDRDLSREDFSGHRLLNKQITYIQYLINMQSSCQINATPQRESTQQNKIIINQLKVLVEELKKGIQLNKLLNWIVAQIYFHYNISVVYLKIKAINGPNCTQCSSSLISYHLQATARMLHHVNHILIDRNGLRNNSIINARKVKIINYDNIPAILPAAQQRLSSHIIRSYIYIKLSFLAMQQHNQSKCFGYGELCMQQCIMAIYYYCTIILKILIDFIHTTKYNMKHSQHAIPHSNIQVSNNNEEIRKQFDRIMQCVQQLYYFIQKSNQTEQQLLAVKNTRRAVYQQMSDKNYTLFKRRLESVHTNIRQQVKWLSLYTLVDLQSRGSSQPNHSGQKLNTNKHLLCSILVGLQYIGFNDISKITNTQNKLYMTQISQEKLKEITSMYVLCLYTISRSIEMKITKKNFQVQDQSHRQLKDISKFILLRSLELSKLFINGSEISNMIQQEFMIQYHPQSLFTSIKEKTQECEHDDHLQQSAQYRHCYRGPLLVCTPSKIQLKQLIKYRQGNSLIKTRHQFIKNTQYNDKQDSSLHKKKLRVRKKQKDHSREQIVERISNVYSSLGRRSKNVEETKNSSQDREYRKYRIKTKFINIAKVDFHFDNAVSSLKSTTNNWKNLQNQLQWRIRQQKYRKQSSKLGRKGNIKFNTIQILGLNKERNLSRGRQKRLGKKIGQNNGNMDSEDLQGHTNKRQFVHIKRNEVDQSQQPQIDTAECNTVKQNQKSKRRSKLNSNQYKKL